MAARSLLWLVATLAVVATLWLTLLSEDGGHSSTTLPGAGATGGQPAAGGYGGAIGSAQGAVQQSNQDAQRAAGSAAGAP
jgi:hypothetical protein